MRKCKCYDCRKEYKKPNSEGNCPYCGCNKYDDVVDKMIEDIQDLLGG